MAMQAGDIPSQLRITQEKSGQMEIVRFEVRDRLKVLARLEMSLEDYARVQLGQEVTAAFSTTGPNDR